MSSRFLASGLLAGRLLAGRGLAGRADPARYVTTGVVEGDGDPAGQAGGEFPGLPGRPATACTADDQKPETIFGSVQREAPRRILRQLGSSGRHARYGIRFASRNPRCGIGFAGRPGLIRAPKRIR